MRVRLVTWNVHACVGSDGRHDPRRVAEVLGRLDAEVIGLQEVDRRHERVDGRDQLELLAQRLGMRVLAGPNLRDERGEYGNALLTRLEVDGVRRVDLAWAGREPRGAIDAILRGPDGMLRVLVTHLGLGLAERRAQALLLREAVLEGETSPALPTVLIGDLNEWRPARLAPRPLVPDPFPVGVAARTWPSRLPLFPLDCVLARPAPASLEHRVVRGRAARAASDHLPLLAEIVWASTRAS